MALKELKLAYQIFKLEMLADGDFSITYSPITRKWTVRYEGDLYSNWVQGNSIQQALEYYISKKIKWKQ